MAFDSPVANNNSHPFSSHSSYKKTVTLKDWWLTKPQSDDDVTTSIGVAGLNCTSQQNRAARCFSSAPILKVYDFWELETVDSVCIRLEGYINKDRTLESGFPPEVFDHFLFGFPHNWGEFCTSCPKRESPDKCVSKVNEDGKDSIEGHADFLDNSDGKLHDYNSDIVDMGVKDCEDTILSDKINTVRDASALEVSHEHVIKAGHEVLSERSLVTSELEDNPSLEMTRISIDVRGMNHNAVKKAADSSTKSKCLGASSRRLTRSMRKMDNSKNSSLPLLHEMSNLDKVTLIDPENLAVNVIDCDVKSESRKIVSNETASCSEETVLSMKSKRKLNEQNVDIKNKLTSRVGISNQGGNKDADVSGESEIDTITSNLEAKCFKSVCLDPLSSIEDFNFASGVIDVNDDPRTNTKDCRNKKKSRVDVSHKEGVPATRRIDSKETVMTRSKSRSKLTPGSSQMAKRKLVTSPKSTKSTSRAKTESCASAKIFSPESFSGKKSRSGRVLLPTLEFWRNQKVVYDADRHVCGVEEPI